jgi:hypothetical protein
MSSILVTLLKLLWSRKVLRKLTKKGRSFQPLDFAFSSNANPFSSSSPSRTLTTFC